MRCELVLTDHRIRDQQVDHRVVGVVHPRDRICGGFGALERRGNGGGCGIHARSLPELFAGGNCSGGLPGPGRNPGPLSPIIPGCYLRGFIFSGRHGTKGE